MLWPPSARRSRATKATWDSHSPERRAQRIEAIRQGNALTRFKRKLNDSAKPLAAAQQALGQLLKSTNDLTPLCVRGSVTETVGQWSTCLDAPPQAPVWPVEPLFGFDRWGMAIAAEQAQLDIVERCLAQGRSSIDTTRLLGVGGHRRRGGIRWVSRHVRFVLAKWKAEGRRRMRYAPVPLSGVGEQACEPRGLAWCLFATTQSCCLNSHV